MRTVMRPRYYCDHCKKGTGSPSYMKRHERGCTANPSRYCGYCQRTPDTVRLAEIMAYPGTSTEDWKAKMVDLRKAADNCPACILAAIRQSKVQQFDPDPETGAACDDSMIFDGAMLGFDWKTESRQWKEAHQPEPQYPCY